LDLRKSEFVTSEEKIAKLKNYITNNGITNEIVKIVINRIIVLTKAIIIWKKVESESFAKGKKVYRIIWCGLN